MKKLANTINLPISAAQPHTRKRVPFAAKVAGAVFVASLVLLPALSYSQNITSKKLGAKAQSEQPSAQAIPADSVAKMLNSFLEGRGALARAGAFVTSFPLLVMDSVTDDKPYEVVNPRNKSTSLLYPDDFQLLKTRGSLCPTGNNVYFVYKGKVYVFEKTEAK